MRQPFLSNVRIPGSIKRTTTIADPIPNNAENANALEVSIKAIPKATISEWIESTVVKVDVEWATRCNMRQMPATHSIAPTATNISPDAVRESTTAVGESESRAPAAKAPPRPRSGLSSPGVSARTLPAIAGSNRAVNSLAPNTRKANHWLEKRMGL
jgi:hypothetical protein